jgi:UDP-N-acetylmuramoylalanine--D-glutamate ligase
MARWLSRQEARVQVVDSRESPPNLAALAAVAPEVEVIAGHFRADTFQDADIIWLSPGVTPAIPEIAAARAQGASVCSEIDLFIMALEDYCCQRDAQILAITGSNGKTTTTALTAHLLNGAGIPAVACGNISPSLLDALMAAQDAGEWPRVWVLELSSFQLESNDYLPVRAATVLNVTEDHLDRHSDMAGYANVKARICMWADALVLNRDDDWSLGMRDAARRLLHTIADDLTPLPDLTTFGLNPPPGPEHYGIKENAIWLGQQRLIGVDELPLQGLHNAANLMAALALCATLGVTAEEVLPALKTFRGLPHRVETVGERDGILYVDDSKGTNVGATLAAIQGMGRPVAIVLGGDGKGQDFSPLKSALQQQGRAIALIGKDASAIAAAIEGCGLPTAFFDDMSGAVGWLSAQAKRGDCVLLSPACASWDMYRDYAQRAEAFIAAVRQQGSGA